MLVYPSGVDVSSSALRFLTQQLRRHRRAIGSRWRRLSAGRQALLTLAHLRVGHTYAQLAAGFGVGTTTAYRYVTEAVQLLAALAPSLTDAVRTASVKAFVILDGTVLPIDRTAADRPFHSGKHRKHGMNVQVITDPFGRPLWASPALPGAVHDAARARAPRTRHRRRSRRGGHQVLGRQGLPGCRRHGPHPAPGPVGDPLRRPEGGEPTPRKDPGPRRAGRRHPQVLAAPPQTAVLDHPDHQPRPGRPHPSSDQLRMKMERAHCRTTP